MDTETQFIVNSLLKNYVRHLEEGRDCEAAEALRIAANIAGAENEKKASGYLVEKMKSRMLQYLEDAWTAACDQDYQTAQNDLKKAVRLARQMEKAND